MKTFKFITIVLALVTTPLWVDGQTGWTLEECINHAINNNIQIKRSEISAKVADQDLLKSKADVTPTLFAFGRHGINKGLDYNYYDNKYENREFQSGSFGVSGSIDVFRGFSRINTISRNKLNLLAALEDVEHQKNVLVLNIVAGYLQVLYVTELYNMAKEQLQVVELRHNKAKAQLELGQISQADFLEVNAQLTNERRVVVAANNDVRMATLTLAQQLEIEDVNAFTVRMADGVNPENVQMPESMGKILDAAYAELPQMKASELRFQLSKKDFRLAQAIRSPHIFLSYDYTSRYSDVARTPLGVEYPAYSYRDQISDNRFGRVTLSIDIPILNRFYAQTQVSKAKLAISNAELLIEQTRKDILNTVQQSYADALAAKEAYAYTVSSVDNYQEVYNLTASRFDLGQANAVDVGIAKANLNRAQSELMNAKYTYILRVKILDFYRGMPITL